MTTSLYIHIPFCQHICFYCDFCKLLYSPKWADEYLLELRKEILSFHIKPQSLKTIYIGGGTPTVLDDAHFSALLNFCKSFLKQDGEFTVEANPESLTLSKLMIAKENGVNRLSLGVESASARLLTLMGRHHSFKQAKQAVSLAKSVGINNISCDIIYALPSETLSEAIEDGKALVSLKVPHLSAYCLTVNPGTIFANRKYHEMDDAPAADQYDAILTLFRQNGYDRYEVSNFAKKGYESQHNLVYWHDEEYYGAGIGASGYVEGVRYDNVRSLSRYLKGEYRDSEEKVTAKSALEYYFLTTLRLEKGFALADFKNRFGFSFLERYAAPYQKLASEGLLTQNQGQIYCTDKGILLLNRVLIELY